MFSDRFAFAALAVACITAAAAGGHLASRRNTVPSDLRCFSYLPTTCRPNPPHLPCSAL